MWYLGILERGWVPDWVIRRAIRQRCASRLAQEDQKDSAAQQRRLERFLEELRSSPIAIQTDAANEQHYELPPEFFTRVLGRRRKYSCGYWPDGCAGLDESEEHMLELTAERAGLADGQRILDLGCGWGSVSLYLAERFPAAQILAVSNSKPQREFISAEARSRGLDNLEVRTADINNFDPEVRFDRVVSVEMFEHMKNYGQLLRRIAGWLAPGGALFVHIFVHGRFAYHYEAEGPDDWMARYFFTGGTMPSFDLLEHFDDHLKVVKKWRVSGHHYQQTCEAWLGQMENNRDSLRPILAATYGQEEITRWWVRWRVFFMACSELFGFAEGKEWFVGHYLLRPRDSESPLVKEA